MSELSEEEIIKDIRETNYNEENVEKLLYELENDTGTYSCYDNAMAIIYYKNLYNKEKEKNKELENELDKTTYLLSRCNKRLEDIARELTAEIKTGYDYTEIMQEIQSLKENECTATKCQMIKEKYISKDKIKEKYLEMEQEYAKKVYDNNYNRTEVKKEEMYKRQVYEKLLEDE